MKIATVTLNPAIDQTVRVDHFRPNAVNYAQTMHFDAGGKGINVASFLADAGFFPTVTGFLGQDNADIFEQFFASKNLNDQFVRIPGRTRIGVKIVDEVNQQTTDINMPGLTPPVEAIDTLYRTIERLVDICDWFVLSGTLPPGVPSDAYARLINQLKGYGKQVVLDTSRDALREGIRACPTIVKPNIDELQQLTGQSLTDDRAIEQAARQLVESGIHLVVVSMGEQGAMFVDQTSTLLGVPPSVLVKSTVGAGDAMVAGLIAGLIRGSSLADCARLATAFSLGAITRLGSQLPDLQSLHAYAEQVSIHTSTSVPRSV
ncbi:MAG TPA: 1-phosphofructokinase [Ktedonobacteraceae bacterium]|nr:1-phosphofructokinase [Ktedonobacteraceae bacterium]